MDCASFWLCSEMSLKGGNKTLILNVRSEYSQLASANFWKQSILSSNQSGFRKKHSTSTVMTDMVDDMLRSWDQSDITSLVLLDMSKAFDSINVGCMLSKLRYYGLADSLLSWFKAYLNHRQQYVLVYKNGTPDTSATGELNWVGLP